MMPLYMFLATFVALTAHYELTTWRLRKLERKRQAATREMFDRILASADALQSSPTIPPPPISTKAKRRPN